jgi:hypothetical protein
LGAKTAVRPLVLGLACAAGPAAWSFTLLANYVLVARACGPEVHGVLHGLSITMLVITALAAFPAWRALGQARAQHGSDEGIDDASRQHFFAMLALLSCALFVVAIGAQFVSPWIVHACG